MTGPSTSRDQNIHIRKAPLLDECLHRGGVEIHAGGSVISPANHEDQNDVFFGTGQALAAGGANPAIGSVRKERIARVAINDHLHAISESRSLARESL